MIPAWASSRPRAAACASPSAVSGASSQPCQRPSAFQADSPWRRTRTRCTRCSEPCARAAIGRFERMPSVPLLRPQPRRPAVPPPPRSFFTRSDGFRLACTLFFVPVVWLIDAPESTRLFVIAWWLANHVICVGLEHYEAKHPNLPVVALLAPLGAITAFVFSQLNDSVRFISFL